MRGRKFPRPPVYKKKKKKKKKKERERDVTKMKGLNHSSIPKVFVKEVIKSTEILTSTAFIVTLSLP